MSSVLQAFPKFENQRREIEGIRLKAADLAQDSLGILDRAFITPLDREDILALITGMNSVIQEIAELSGVAQFVLAGKLQSADLDVRGNAIAGEFLQEMVRCGHARGGLGVSLHPCRMNSLCAVGSRCDARQMILSANG